MLWYVAVIAALNLCLGYYWAVRTRACPKCARARAAELRAKASLAAGGATKPAISAAAATSVSVDSPQDDSTENVTKDMDAPVGGQVSDAQAPATAGREAPLQDFLTGLEAFRSELTDVDRQLQQSDESADHVARCALRLGKAHDDYLGLASAAIEEMDAEPFASQADEAGPTTLKERVRGQIELVTASKTELDRLDVAADPLAARASLQKTTGQLNESTEGLRTEVDDCLRAMWSEFESPEEPAAAAVPLDPATGLVTREHAEYLLKKMTTDEIGRAPVTVALLELSGAAAGDAATDEAVEQRLVCSVSNIVRQSLAPNHTAARYSDQQFLLLVPREDVNQAMRRTEQVRQRVANTEFVADGRAIKTTVTCALAELSKERSSEALFGFLLEALGEAKRYGGNRTFMHDGNSPTPIVPPELMVAPQQLAI